MSTYKVIQDIESEDKLIGPFGIRQFIYLIIVAVTLFVGFKIATLLTWFLALPLFPIVLFFGLLALPFGGEQPTETWLLAKIRFAMKPRIRIWDQDGIQELVIITAPKKNERTLTKNLSQGEVQSRLKALANTIDSRGWAIKNVSMDIFQPSMAGAGSDRLVSVSLGASSPQISDVTLSEDMLDERNNPTAQKLDQMISATSKARRDQIVQNMKQPATPTPQTPPSPPNGPIPTQPSSSGSPDPDYWFMNNPAGAPTPPPGASAFQDNQVVQPDPGAMQPSGLPLKPLAPPSGPITEDELLEKIHTNKQTAPKNYGHMRVIKTLEEQEAEAKAAAAQAATAAAADVARQAAAKAQTPVTPAPDPDIIELANNDDLNVDTIARQANKRQQDRDDGEVVINLH